jgi:hypothetical protein
VDAKLHIPGGRGPGIKDHFAMANLQELEAAVAKRLHCGEESTF